MRKTKQAKVFMKLFAQKVSAHRVGENWQDAETSSA
jgi:hypothetical protein